MFISFAASRSGGFKSWSDAHLLAGNTDDDPTGTNVVALAVLIFEDIQALEQPRYQWVVPAVSVSL
jgi:hypothetical protein